MKLLSTTKRVLRGELTARTALREAARRVNAKLEQRRERASLSLLNQPARLGPEFAGIPASGLLAHFRSRGKPKFFPGFDNPKHTAELQKKLFPEQTAQLIAQAQRIATEHSWPLLGFGEKCFGAGDIDWNRDPLSGFHWPPDYHADIWFIRNDGSDARVTWELNRLAHLVTLARAFVVTNDERFSEEFFRQLSSWRAQNPVGRGVNWSCAMEVALRAMNLLAAFALLLRSPQMNELRLTEMLTLFDQHGGHIKRNLEFSHIANSNHYLADLTGMLWLGVLLPELQAAAEWREFGLRELLSEMDKQILSDGADYEASTGYHRLKVELFLYSFVLCHLNGINIDERYWAKLRAMVDYVRAYLRPNGRAPLIGDSDSGQVLPIVRRDGDDHAYLLAMGAAVFQEPRFKVAALGTHTSGVQHAGGVCTAPEELLWILGEQGVRDYAALPESEAKESQAFPAAGVYILRHNDLYLHFNAGGIGVNGRGSHGHNDALSIEASACGTAFIVDPGTYLYVANLRERQLFRSTAYHSTVQVDSQEQNTIEQTIPFIIGNEAKPKALTWETNSDFDFVAAEHRGYERFSPPVTHRRSIRFDKRARFWLIEDELSGEGTHEIVFRFHFAPDLETKVRPDGIVSACDKMSGAHLLIKYQQPDRKRGQLPSLECLFEPQFTSQDYGSKEPSTSVCWKMLAAVPIKIGFVLIPMSKNENASERLRISSEAV